MSEYNKAGVLKEILKLAKEELFEPGDDIGYTMPDGKYHIYIFVDDADEKIYVVEPNKVVDGAHEPIGEQNYLAAYNDFGDLAVGCLFCMDEFEFDAKKERDNIAIFQNNITTEEPALNNKIKLDFGFATLVVEKGCDPYYQEVFIGLEDSEGAFLQDLAIVGRKYHYENDELCYEDKISVKVFSDEYKEDYTHDFTIDLYEWKNEEEISPLSLSELIKSAEEKSLNQNGSKGEVIPFKAPQRN